MYGREIVRALVSAFNVHNYARNTVKTNFTLQSRGGEDCIVVSFDKGMNRYQCSRYLDSIKRKIIREFYGIEESNDKEILDTAKKDFDVTSFPFNYIYKGDWSVDKQGRIEFVVPVDQGVIFNLKSHLAASLAKGVLEDMRVSSTAVPFNKKKYLWCGEFDNGRLSQQFEREFLSRMENRYGYRNGFKNPLKVKGNSVYIRDVFDDARFIDSVARYITWLKGMGLQADSKVRGDVKAFKELIMEFIDQPTEIIIAGFVCASPLGREEASVLIPLVLNGGRKRILTNEEALKLNHAFNGAVFNDLYGGTQGELAINGGNGLYSIDFSNPEISHCVITKIIESSVINAKHELSIDPELRFRASTPVHNGPNSDLTGTSIQGFPTRSQGDALKESARQGSEKEEGSGPRVLHNSVSLAVAGPSSAPSAGPSLCPQSGPLSSRGTQAGSEKEEKLIEALLDMFNFNNYIDEIHTNFTLENGKIVGFLNVDKGEYLQKVRNDIIKKHCGTEEEARKVYDFGQLPFVFPPDSNYEEDEGVTDIAYNVRGAVFNLKIHLIQEFKRGVEDEVIKKLEKEMKMKKEEVRKCIRKSVHLEKVSNPTSYLCDISFSNEYFQNQSELSEELGIDVETLFKEFKNIYVEEFKSRLKKCNLDVSLVSHDGNMLHIKNAIDIEFVKKVKKCARKEVPVNQFPRKEVIMEVPIVLQDGFYILDTSEIPSETRPPLRQRARPIEGTSKAGKGEPKGNQDSGYSSGFITDAENASSTEATTSSGYESMDCDNTGGGSPKRALELSMGMEELAISTDLDATKVKQHSPIKKFRSN
ncbi:hypothetical protein [Wolbachia endosymbiont of Oedothorax gibbosus]|uniref:hypothetical protein n=1 Tax=Wolbachia endosymbiont of Oedothorax gibbosus TaxID=931100 RepID=UPI002023F3C9|nr:hypothetical protein [Wolbachia endosymbiont of Oedothorax gibbosus]